jgi:hypothetical protein
MKRAPNVDVFVETDRGAFIAYAVHVNNRSHACLHGAVRAAFRKYPNARGVEARYITDEPVTRVYVPSRRRYFAIEA